MNDPVRRVYDSDRDRLVSSPRTAALSTHKASAAGILVSLLALAGLLACGPSRAHAAAPVPRCATLEARALTSPNAPVAGAFACLAPDLAQRSGLSSDADIQAIAASEPVYTSYRYLGHTTKGYYFEFSAGNVAAGCGRFHIDDHGQVDRVGSGEGACPRPLP